MDYGFTNLERSTYNEMDNVVVILNIAVQLAVVWVLVKHGRSFADQVKEARRDAVVRMRIQLGDIYVRRLAEDLEPARERLLDQMGFLLQGYDQLAGQAGYEQDDKLIKKIRDECRASGQ